MPSPVLGPEGAAVNKRNNPCPQELNVLVNWEMEKHLPWEEGFNSAGIWETP